MSKPKRYSDFTPERVRLLWKIFAAALVASLIAGFFVHPHAHFGIDGTLFFNAWYGFFACAGIIFISKLLGIFLKRPESYYHTKD